MRFPRVPARPWFAAATVVIAVAVLILVSVGNTRATERESPEIADSSPSSSTLSLSNSGISSWSAAA